MQQIRCQGQISTDIYRRDRDWERLNKRGGANYDGLGLLGVGVAVAGLGLLHAYGNRRHNSNPTRPHNNISTTIATRNRSHTHISTTIAPRNRSHSHISTTTRSSPNSTINYLAARNRNRTNHLGAFYPNLAAINALSNDNFNNALNNFNNSSNALRSSAAA